MDKGLDLLLCGEKEIMIKKIANHSEIRWTYALIIAWIILIAFSHVVHTEASTSEYCTYQVCL